MKMTESEKKLYLEGSSGLAPYLRMQDKGMPQGKVNQIAWLLLNGSGCGFCKVCRDEPCNIKDGEKCTTNIANYIREIVKAEQQSKTDWIPCEERLPENDEDVLVQMEDDSIMVDFRTASSSGWFWADNDDLPIAWQPLPAPYKKEGAE